MPNKHFYVAMGVGHVALLTVGVRLARQRLYARYAWFRALYRWHRDWFLYFPLVFIPSALWGLVPDILHATGLLPKEETRGPLFNLFFFHSWFEWLEDAYPRIDWLLNSMGSLVLFLVALGTQVFYLREYHRASAATPKNTGRGF